MVLPEIVAAGGADETGLASLERDLRQDARLPSDVASAFVRAVKASSGSPLAAAFLTRSLKALAQVITEASPQDLAHAVSASSDLGTFYRTMEIEEFLDPDVQEEDFFAEARLRGRRMQQEILREEGGTLSAAEVASLLNITRQAVDKRRLNSTLLALELGRRGYRYPAWQFDGKRVLVGFAEILRAMPIESSWMRASFFLAGNIYLNGERPLDALRAGQIEDVLRAGKAFGEHGAP